MAKTHPIPTRFEEEEIARMRKAAKRLGISLSDIIRLANLIGLPQIESGTITLPLAEDQS